jgi:hypothetical protein
METFVTGSVVSREVKKMQKSIVCTHCIPMPLVAAAIDGDRVNRKNPGIVVRPLANCHLLEINLVYSRC